MRLRGRVAAGSRVEPLANRQFQSRIELNEKVHLVLEREIAELHNLQLARVEVILVQILYRIARVDSSANCSVCVSTDEAWSYVEEDTCMSYEEEDTCVSYEEEDVCLCFHG